MDHHGHPGEKMCRLPLECEGISFGGGMLQALPRVVQNLLVPHNHIFQGKRVSVALREKRKTEVPGSVVVVIKGKMTWNTRNCRSLPASARTLHCTCRQLLD
jgi:hypothetical protein